MSVESPSVDATKRVTRPNKEAYESELSSIQAEFKTKEQELEKARAAVKSVLDKDSNKNPELTSLKEQLNALKSKQNELKASRTKIAEEVKLCDDRMKKKIKELQTIKGKSPFKSVDEIDAKIVNLEKEVESGSMRLVDEKKALGEISSLKKVKKSFSSIQEIQSSIDADKAQIAEIKKSNDFKESNEISKQYEEVLAKINKIRDSQQEAYKNRTAIFDARNALQEERDVIYKKMQAHKDSYFNQLNAFRKFQKQEQAARIEREAAEKEAALKQKKVEEAEENLEIAKEPAFASEIAKANNLINYFSGSSKSEAAGAPTAEAVKLPEGAKLLKKEEESYFVGAGSKKARKAASMKAKESNGSASGKVKLTPDIIDDLVTLQIGVPGSQSEVEETITKIKAKVEFFKENEKKVTAERVEKAEAALALTKQNAEN